MEKQFASARISWSAYDAYQAAIIADRDAYAAHEAAHAANIAAHAAHKAAHKAAHEAAHEAARALFAADAAFKRRVASFAAWQKAADLAAADQEVVDETNNWIAAL